MVVTFLHFLLAHMFMGSLLQLDTGLAFLTVLFSILHLVYIIQNEPHRTFLHGDHVARTNALTLGVISQ